MIELRELDNVRSPREKLEILLAVHKVLVDGLSFPSDDGETLQSSSADLLLPVLIYRFVSGLTDIVSSKRMPRHSYRMSNSFNDSAQKHYYKGRHPIVLQIWSVLSSTYIRKQQ